MKLASGIVVAALASSVAGGCGDDGQQTEADAGVSCAAETRADTFVLGLEKVGTAGITVRLVDALPLPPERGDNTWRLLVLDGETPLDGAIVDIKPFMPDHGHGTTVNEVVTPAGAPGEYTAAPINLWMPGFWQIAVEVEHGMTADSVTFNVCIPG